LANQPGSRATYLARIAGAERTAGCSFAQNVACLDWFIFFVADVQTGFGPFVSVYLTAQKWTQVDIGLVLSAAGLVALAGQIPGGALVDFARSERLVAGLAVAADRVSALAYAAWPILPVVLSAAVLHSGASCVLARPLPQSASSGRTRRGRRAARPQCPVRVHRQRTGGRRDGCLRLLLSARAVFFVTALLLAPALIALRAMSANEIDPSGAWRGDTNGATTGRQANFPISCASARCWSSRSASCCFHLGNAAMLPLMGSVVTMRSSEWATVLIAACIVVPQTRRAGIVAWSDDKPNAGAAGLCCCLGFAALPIRGILFATVTDPNIVVAVQLLDGITRPCSA